MINLRIIGFVLICLLLINVFGSIYYNYQDGKVFKTCTKCPPNKIRYIEYKIPDHNLINNLEYHIRNNGNILDPNLNLSNAQGKKLDYQQIKKLCPELIDYYLNDTFKNYIISIINKNIEFAPESDHYRFFARLYENDDDFLNWHYDNNFTKGKRYTIVIPLLIDECNTSEFQIKDRQNSTIITFKIPIGKGVLYNGSNVYHKITQQKKNCKRLVIIIPIYENYSLTFSGYIRTKIRNITDKVITL